MADSVNARWEELPPAVRQAIEQHTGPVAAAAPGPEGMSTAVRLTLDTPGGSVFIKGTRPESSRLVRERLALGAELAPHVPSLSPPLLFRTLADGWDITGWTAVPGRPADLTPGSPDIPRIVAALAELGTITAPDVPGMLPVADYWGRDTNDPRALDGDALVHTDPHGQNFIVDGDWTWLVDWGWAARGPAWITPMRLILFLLEAGWEPADAEHAIASLPAWTQAPPSVITEHAIASVPSWEKAAARQPANERLRAWAGIARQWADHRAGLTGTRM
ncbi:MAG TPA: hypothetical protein VMU95_08570 [Trebonia sp.]|nr:hypothetical protein [Trebonia sp.]